MALTFNQTLNVNVVPPEFSPRDLRIDLNRQEDNTEDFGLIRRQQTISDTTFLSSAAGGAIYDVIQSEADGFSNDTFTPFMFIDMNVIGNNGVNVVDRDTFEAEVTIEPDPDRYDEYNYGEDDGFYSRTDFASDEIDGSIALGNGLDTAFLDSLLNETETTINDDPVQFFFDLMAGNDIGEAGTLNDRIIGGPVEPVPGVPDQDTLIGRDGDDYISGGYDDDLIIGDFGDDTLGGDDDLDGESGNDVINGNGGDDEIEGGTGADFITGGAGDDNIFGDDEDVDPVADDRPETVGLPAGDEIFGGDGNDFIDGQQGADFIRGGDGSDNIFGGEEDDDIAGNAGDDFINGESGDDDIRGGDGDDQIDGENGNDLIQGNAGMDIIVGGAGDDRIFGNLDRDQINGGSGNDILSGNQGDDTVGGGTGNDFVFGNRGNDVISGEEGNDDVRGGEGNDQVLGEEGNDVLRGGPGSDTLDGGTGDDLMAGNGNDDFFCFSPNFAGTDTAGTFGFDQVFGFDVFGNLELPLFDPNGGAGQLDDGDDDTLGDSSNPDATPGTPGDGDGVGEAETPADFPLPVNDIPPFGPGGNLANARGDRLDFLAFSQDMNSAGVDQIDVIEYTARDNDTIQLDAYDVNGSEVFLRGSVVVRGEDVGVVLGQQTAADEFTGPVLFGGEYVDDISIALTGDDEFGDGVSEGDNSDSDVNNGDGDSGDSFFDTDSFDDVA